MFRSTEPPLTQGFHSLASVNSWSRQSLSKGHTALVYHPAPSGGSLPESKTLRGLRRPPGQVEPSEATRRLERVRMIAEHRLAVDQATLGGLRRSLASRGALCQLVPSTSVRSRTRLRQATPVTATRLAARSVRHMPHRHGLVWLRASRQRATRGWDGRWSGRQPTGWTKLVGGGTTTLRSLRVNKALYRFLKKVAFIRRRPWHEKSRPPSRASITQAVCAPQS